MNSGPEAWVRSGGECRETKGDRHGWIWVNAEEVVGGKDPGKVSDKFLKEVRGHSRESTTSLKCSWSQWED